jgi:hypothetical protein
MRVEKRAFKSFSDDPNGLDDHDLGSRIGAKPKSARELVVRLVRGSIKVQHGVYRIYEVLKTPTLPEEKSLHMVTGYAIFDLHDKRMSKIFSRFQAVVDEIGKLL